MTQEPRLDRRGLLALGALGLAASALPRTAVAAAPLMEVWKSPTCGCCGAWVEHVRAAGFDATDREAQDLAPLKARLSVPLGLQSCHTALIDGYVVEGHVPADDILRLLDERPGAIGLAVPGMPAGSPGMETGGARDPFEVVLFALGRVETFSRH